jgi:uroporphyrinogen decarboxylase
MTSAATPLSSREKVLRAISRRGPAPFPRHLRLSPALVEHFHRETGSDNLDAHFGLDLRWLYCARPEQFAFDADLSQREFDALFDFAGVARLAEETKAAGLAVVSGYEPGTFEQAHEIRGLEGLLMDVISEPAATKRFLERIAINKARVAVGYAKAGVDIVFIGDDMGSQRALLVREETWHAFFRPALEHIVREVRAVRPDARIAYHSCGHIEPLVPYLIEAGIDVLEAVQPECNDVPRIVGAYGDRLAFWGAIGAQSTMARGTPEEVRAAVLALTGLFPPGSGLIVAPAHTLEPDTPPENVVAFVEAVEEVNRLAPRPGTLP